VLWEAIRKRVPSYGGGIAKDKKVIGGGGRKTRLFLRRRTTPCLEYKLVQHGVANELGKGGLRPRRKFGTALRWERQNRGGGGGSKRTFDFNNGEKVRVRGRRLKRGWGDEHMLGRGD